ncbi:hypothetical protein CXB51_007479 [Gossypium anomalum]|uniref:Uncharacterized protein n=1 Tax=Gossypium anomalum TaxID=47600 RepID=A0A8J6D9S0_9ROSI|nr:hypothetical protein CXB51_007479 [Gossypium anomalum]
MKRWFDPWPVFFKREFNRTWPFLVGFAVTGTIITKFSLGLTEEDAKNSPFAQKHKSNVSNFRSYWVVFDFYVRNIEKLKSFIVCDAFDVIQLISKAYMVAVPWYERLSCFPFSFFQ